MTISLTPSDPRYARYNALQQTLTLATNAHCHWRLSQALGDPLVWRKVHLPALQRDVAREMRAVMRGGRDG